MRESYFISVEETSIPPFNCSAFAFCYSLSQIQLIGDKARPTTRDRRPTAHALSGRAVIVAFVAKT